MITIEETETGDRNWNSRLLSSEIGTIYHTLEYGNFLLSKNYQPKFVKFLDQTGNIVGQLLVSTYSIFEKKTGLKKFLKHIPNSKKFLYRWIFGPVIFDHSKSDQIHLELGDLIMLPLN